MTVLKNSLKPAIEFIDIVKSYPDSTLDAIDHVSEVIYPGEFITILGSSGSGKTTLLKMVNRLIEPTSGEIKIFDRDILLEDPVLLRRQIGYVIQQVGLFPHMTIYENCAVVLRLLKTDEATIKERIYELMKLIGLDESYLERYPSQLSGGQQQRIGLVRALAAKPDIMLLDEPFGAIDAINRIKLQEDIIKIHQSAQKTFLFVTHDVNEAFYLGTRVMIMDQGKVQQFDTPHNIVKHPTNSFVRNLIESSKQQLSFWESLND